MPGSGPQAEFARPSPPGQGRGIWGHKRLGVGVLGPLELIQGASSVPLGGTKQRAMLVLHVNRVVSTDALVDGLWTAPPDLAS